MVIKRESGKVRQPTINRSDPEWQIAGELELAPGMNTHRMVKAWLSDMLAPLHLHLELINKIFQSAEDAVARAGQADTMMNYERTHLLIYIPANCPWDAQTWGFFRIEKVGSAGESANRHAHSIEFYLYPEGK